MSWCQNVVLNDNRWIPKTIAHKTYGRSNATTTAIQAIKRVTTLEICDLEIPSFCRKGTTFCHKKNKNVNYVTDRFARYCIGLNSN